MHRDSRASVVVMREAVDKVTSSPTGNKVSWRSGRHPNGKVLTGSGEGVTRPIPGPRDIHILIAVQCPHVQQARRS